MRTTITLVPDTLALLQREIARNRVSFKRAVNDAIRRGLTSPPRPTERHVEVLPFRSDYQPGIDRLRLQQLADDLETEDAARQGGRQS